MTTITLADDTFSRWGSWTGARGTVEYLCSTPSGYQFSNATLEIHDGGADIRGQPEAGTIGSLLFRVRWYYGAFGKARYTFRAYAEEIPVPEEASSRQRILIRRGLHQGEWFGDSGVDEHSVPIPAGYSFKQIKLLIRNTAGPKGQAQRTDSIPPGSTGDLPFRVSWSYPAFGKIGYRLYVYAEEGAEYCLNITSASWVPNPAQAGLDVNFDLTVQNIGSQTLENVRFIGSIYAINLVDDSLGLLESQSEADRTQEVYNEMHSLNIAPGETSPLSIQIPIPARATESWSTAGLYRVTILAQVDSLIIGSDTIEDFEVTR